MYKQLFTYRDNMGNITNFKFFFFNDTAPTEFYTLSLHDALPIFLSRDRDLPSVALVRRQGAAQATLLIGNQLLPGRSVATTKNESTGKRPTAERDGATNLRRLDRKSTRLNSSHLASSYAVFCSNK